MHGIKSIMDNILFDVAYLDYVSLRYVGKYLPKSLTICSITFYTWLLTRLLLSVLEV